MSILPLSTPSMRAFLVLPRPCAPLTRSFASSVRYRKTPPSDFVLDQEPARAARQAAEEASRRKNVGPFPMGQPAQDGHPRRPWHDLGGGERLGRSVVNSSNLLVVLFGVTVSGLVIYAVSSELFATNSPTKIFEQCTEMLKRDEETKSILLEPIRYHAESSGGRRNRRVLSSMSVDAATGREKMTVKFAVEGRAPDAPADETYWHRFKRWIRPVIAEPSDASALIPTPPNRERVVKPEDDPPKSWVSSIFGSILPSALGGSSSTSSSPTPPSARLRSKPAKGTFSGGEAIAVLLLDDKGVFNLKSLTVYYPSEPDSHHLLELKTDANTSRWQMLASGNGRRTFEVKQSLVYKPAARARPVRQGIGSGIADPSNTSSLCVEWMNQSLANLKGPAAGLRLHVYSCWTSSAARVEDALGASRRLMKALPNTLED